MAENLRIAMTSRATIEQAKGMIMASRRCTPEEAFETLVRASQRSNLRLRDIAARIVDGASVDRRGNDGTPATIEGT
jgi:AmiR/NasT family two-component response regulator